MDTFWKLLQESVIVQALITLVLVIAVAYLSITQQPVPDLLSTSLMLVLGFYFGQKTQQQVYRARKE
jgi:hypothetical protein